MNTHIVEFQIVGAVEIKAASADEAQEKFDRMNVRDLAEQGELEQLSEPYTQEDLAQKTGT